MNRKIFAAVFAFLIFGILAVPKAKADVDGDMTFNIKGGPVEIPGHVLTPGQYSLQFENEENSIVLIRAANTGQTIGLFLVEPQYSPNVPDKPEVQLSEGTKISTGRVLGFYDPSLSEGFDFICPHSPVATRPAVASGAMSR